MPRSALFSPEKCNRLSLWSTLIPIGSSVDEIPRTIGGLGTTILSTSKGVMSDADARNQKIGGEVLISVF